MMFNLSLIGLIASAFAMANGLGGVELLILFVICAFGVIFNLE